MDVGGVDQLGVDLVADHDEVVAVGDLGDRRQLARREHVPRRVVRMAQHEQTCLLGGQASVERIVVEHPSVPRAFGGDLDDTSAGLADGGEERVVRRHVQHDPVAGLGEVVDRRDDTLHDVDELVQAALVRDATRTVPTMRSANNAGSGERPIPGQWG